MQNKWLVINLKTHLAFTVQLAAPIIIISVLFKDTKPDILAPAYFKNLEKTFS